MALYFLASIAGLFPALTLPLAVGWKSIHVFDLLFAACIGLAAIKRAWHPPDWRLILAGGSLVAAGGIALWVHPSAEGARTVSAIAYSVVVLLSISHIRLDAIGVRVDRTILWPLLVAVGIAWAVFLVENLLGIAVGRNQSAALPSSVHRFGGLTGANALILFLCLGAPFTRAPWLIVSGILLPAFGTLSRSMLGVGIGMIMRDRSQRFAPGPTRRVILFGSWSCVVLSLFAYAFAAVPTDPSQRATLRMSFEAGGYLTTHQAALRMFARSPVLGVGPARFIEEFGNITSQDERSRLADNAPVRRDPHSAILGLAAEQGLLGLVSFGWLIGEIFVRLSRIPDPPLRSAAMAGLIGLLVGGHFVDWLALKGLWFWIGLMVASRSPTQGNLRGISL